MWPMGSAEPWGRRGRQCMGSAEVPVGSAEPRGASEAAYTVGGAAHWNRGQVLRDLEGA